MRHKKGMRIAACSVRSSLCLVFADSLFPLHKTDHLSRPLHRPCLFFSLSPFSIFFFFFLCPPGGLTTVVPVGIYHCDHRLSAMFSSLLCYNTVFSKFFFFPPFSNTIVTSIFLMPFSINLHFISFHLNLNLNSIVKLNSVELVGTP